MGERETLRSGSAAWAGTVALALGAATTHGSPASASTVITGEAGVDVTVTPVGVDLTNYTSSDPYVVYFQGSPAFDVYFTGVGEFNDQHYEIAGVNSGDLLNGVAGYATKLGGGVTINSATFTSPQNSAGMKNPVGSRPNPFYVPLEVTTDGGKDFYYGWAEFSDADVTLDSYAFANTATPAPTRSRAPGRCSPSEQRACWRFAVEAGAWLRPWVTSVLIPKFSPFHPVPSS